MSETALWDDTATWTDSQTFGEAEGTGGTITITYTPPAGQTPTSLHIDSTPPIDVPAVHGPLGWTFTLPAPADGSYTRQILHSSGYVDRGRISFVDGQVISPSWIPAASRVAAIVPQRTQPTSGAGVALGQFTTATVPTLAQVNEDCQVIAREVEAACGPGLPADLQDSAADVAALGAAARVELAFYRQSDSRYDELQAAYREALERLVASVIARRDGETIPGDGPGADLPPSPLGSFPPPMTTLLERW